MIINCLRTYLANKTSGEIWVNGELFGPSLEDPGRPVNVKIDSQTCIPEGAYKVTITQSTRFNKRMIQLFNRPDLSVENDGIRFTGIRVHNGSTVEHTAGCPLVPGYEKLQEQVQEVLDAGEEVLWVVSNIGAIQS